MLFYIFSGLLCMSALQVVTAKNPVHAVLFLILCFAASSALFIMQGAEFLGLVLILVYVGAVMVLFLFVVMMLDIKHMLSIKQSAKQYIPLLFVIAAVLIGQIIYILSKSKIFLNDDIDTANHLRNIENGVNYTSKVANTKALGKLIFTEYLFAFEIVGFILLVAIIIAVILTLRTRKDNKAIDTSEQINIQAKDRIVLVDSKVSTSN